MNEKLQQLEEKIAQMHKGIWSMSTKRARALSTHETEELCDALEVVAREAMALLKDVQENK